MPVTAFRLENFMAFRDTGWLELRPITLFFGRNSSGKSAIIRALRMLKQSMDSYPEPFKVNDEYGVSLGTIQEIINGGIPENGSNEDTDPKIPPLRFSFRCNFSRDNPSLFQQLLHVVNTHRARLGLEELSEEVTIKRNRNYLDLQLEYRWDSKERILLFSEVKVEYPWATSRAINHQLIFRATKPGVELIDFLGDVWDFQTDILHSHEEEGGDIFWSKVYLELTEGFIPNIKSQLMVGGKTANVVDEYRLLANLFDFFYEVIKNFLENSAHLGALRPPPELYYIFKMFDEDHWKKLGWGAFYDLLTNQVNTPNMDLLEKWLRYLDLGTGVFINHIGGERSEMGFSSLRIGQNPGQLKPFITNVGYGTAQVLPILIQSIQSTSENLIIIEQPELHLHPKAQADLADLFIASVLKRKSRFLLETHSEHLILRIMRRMREEFNQKASTSRSLPEAVSATNYRNGEDEPLPFDSTYISIYYVDREKDVTFSTIYEMELDEEGRLKTPWPNGFFEEGFRERFLIND